MATDPSHNTETVNACRRTDKRTMQAVQREREKKKEGKEREGARESFPRSRAGRMCTMEKRIDTIKNGSHCSDTVCRSNTATHTQVSSACAIALTNDHRSRKEEQ